MKAISVVLFALSANSVLVSTSNVYHRATGAPINPARLVGYVLGSFSVPVILLILAFTFWNKSTSSRGIGSRP